MSHRLLEEMELKRPPNPLENASILSLLTFSWPYTLIEKGLQGPITEFDIPEVLEDESSAPNRKLMDDLWRAEKEAAVKEKRAPCLCRVVLKIYFSKLWYLQPLFGVTSASKIGAALSLGRLIQTFEVDQPSHRGYAWAASLVFCSILPLISHHQTYFRTWRMGIQLRIAAIALIYSKSLRLSSIGGSLSTSSGQVVNLASNDVERFLFGSLFLPYLFWGPLEAIVVLIIGLLQIGPSFAAGYAVLLIFVPLQFVLSNQFATIRSQVAAITDERVSLLSQAIGGIRVIKMNGWELQFADKIYRVRQKEIAKVQKTGRLKAANEAIFFSTNVSVAIAIFLCHVWTGHVLTTFDVFTTFTLINVVQITMTKFFAYAIMSVSECYVSIKRIQDFLESHEIKTSATVIIDASVPLVRFTDVTCFWEADSLIEKSAEELDLSDQTDKMMATSVAGTTRIIALDKISLDLEAGRLYCVIGPVGASKSALLQALSGEILPSKGKIERRALSIAYSSQDPWIMNGTVRENITMGLDFDCSRYEEVVNSCGLNLDFQQFMFGDTTLVGDRGIQCSGGQRARIGLARALYRDADLILLDDPLSAVDSKVGRLIYESAIQEMCIKRGKCVVLVTHQHQFIGKHTCLLMNKGQIMTMGTYDDCVAYSGGLLRGVIHAQYQESNNKDDCVSAPKRLSVDPKTDQKESTDMKSSNSDSQAEVNKDGHVELKTWQVYISAMGGALVCVSLIFIFAGSQACLLATISLIGRCSEHGHDVDQIHDMASIGWLGVLVICLSLGRSTASFHLCIKASRHLHDRMTIAVLRSEVAFFDTNPVGRILNRFSADVGTSDDQIPACVNDTLSMGFIVLGGVVVAATVMPFLLFALPPIFWYFLRIRSIFVKSSCELKRIEGMARSPIFAMMSESVAGIATIRSNGLVDYCTAKFETIQNAHSSAFFAFMSTTRWLNFRLESITVALLALACFLAVLLNDQRWLNVNPSTLGLSLTLLLQMSGLLQWFTRQSSELINQMVAIERMLMYADLPSEAPLDLPEDEVLIQWPGQGRLDVCDLSVRHRTNLPPALSGLTFHVESGQRLGIVGRTGSGKSTFIQALFRLLEAETGRMELDGVRIDKVGLHKLRTSMSVITQTPFLFSGCSIRENLDPFLQYDDDAVAASLVEVQLSDVVTRLPNGLDTIVAEGGSNFSVGQRQLLCVARAILQKTKMIILDEPTANVDTTTDVLLQRAIMTSFPNATVIAVAHRLDTIIGYDKILVFGNGELLEFGSPHDLLEKGGHFRSMVDETGDMMAKELRARAAEHASRLDETDTKVVI